MMRGFFFSEGREGGSGGQGGKDVRRVQRLYFWGRSQFELFRVVLPGWDGVGAYLRGQASLV